MVGNLFDDTIDKGDSSEQFEEGNFSSSGFRNYYNLESGGLFKLHLMNYVGTDTKCIYKFQEK